MDLFGLGGRAFRSRLKRELPRWREEGLVGPDAEHALFERYQLGEEGVSVAAAAIYTLGALLIGGGVLSFVAWNWEDLPRAGKLLLLGAALAGAHGAGWWLWRTRPRYARLGHALTLLGTLIFGANIGLVAQIFHIHADPSAGFGAWALGAAVAAWALWSTPNAALACGLAVTWGFAHYDAHHSLLALLPFVVTVPFLPIAWIKRSRFLFAVTALAYGTMAMSMAGFATKGGGPVFVAGFAAAHLLLALRLGTAEEETRGQLGSVGMVLGFLALAGLAYPLTFHGLAREFDLGAGSAAWLWFTLPALAGGLGIAAWKASDLVRRPATLCGLAGTLALAVALLASAGATAIAVLANAALIAVAIVSITSSVRTLERAPFWYGSLLGGLLILSRFLEFETELWLKAIVFLACGIAVIAFGASFERRRRAAAEAGHAA